MEGQLAPGQWVEVSMEDLETPILLNGFVLSLRPSEVLLTFPELLAPPKGLESEAHATVRFSDSSGSFTALGLIVRVASGPPVTVTFKRLVPIGAGRRPTPVAAPAVLPVALHIVKSRVASPAGPDGIRGTAHELSDTTMLLQTEVLLAVGDTVRLQLGERSNPTMVQGRVIRVERQGKTTGQFFVGVEPAHDSEDERERWREVVHRWRQS